MGHIRSISDYLAVYAFSLYEILCTRQWTPLNPTYGVSFYVSYRDFTLSTMVCVLGVI